MSYQPIVSAPLAFNAAGIPYSPLYDDIYHSDSGGLDQADHVFVAGNDLPDAWRGRRQFVILETGFGIGLNFLATWRAWRGDPARSEKLHFVSVEKHPFSHNDLALLHQRWPQLRPMSNELLSQWPPLTPGIHRLQLDDGRVTLTLCLGDATTQIRRLSVQADALYLDGFAPARNPELWDAQFLKFVTRLCKPGATLATWSVASNVRAALDSMRWTLEKRPGFGSKRDMLCGKLFGQPISASLAQHAIVIGAGIAGTSIAERLAQRGWKIDLIERSAAPASSASGNPVGLLHPMLAKDDNLAARLSRAGYLYTLRLLEKLDRESSDLRWNQCGIFQLARDAEQEIAQRETADALNFPDGFVSFLDRATAAQRIGHAITAGGWFFPGGAIVDPGSLCRALLARHPDSITAYFNTDIARVHHDGMNWNALDSMGRNAAAAPVLILANAFHAADLIPQCALPISKLRGQISLLPRDALPSLRHAICGNGYVTPNTSSAPCIGATFDMDDDDDRVRIDSHEFNLERLRELVPGTPAIDPECLEGRVGFRTLAVDRIPIVGAMPDAKVALKNGAQLRDVSRLPGLYALLALGSRGLSWGPLGAELLAAQLNQEPLPIERDLVNAIDPGRFLIRQQRRSISSLDSNFQDL